MADAGLVKAMARKRERHFNESKTVLAVALMMFGACACFCLVLVWPQSYLIQVFNSKLAYHLILDVEDYFTCNKEYVNFVIDEPDYASAMFTIFVFNVSNSDDVIQRGNKPDMVETGPYGFMRHTYKYDISFPEPYDSTTVQFKEYSILKPISDTQSCEAMYYRMDRDNLQPDPCSGVSCLCKSYDSLVTIVNPILFKMLYEETPTQMIAYHSAEIFTEIKRVLEDPFTEAVKAHLVSVAYKEIYLFRTQMQSGLLLNDSVNTLLQTYTIEDIIANGTVTATTCGLAKYGVSSCPMKPFYAMHLAKLTDLNVTDYPSVGPLLNISNKQSVLNFEYGLPRFVGLIWYFGYATFNGVLGYSSVTKPELRAVRDELADFLAIQSFGPSYTAKQYLGAQRMVAAFAKFINDNYINAPLPLFFSNTILKPLTVTEFTSGYDPVACSPLGRKCVWQFGYLTHYEGLATIPSSNLIIQMIDTAFETGTNPVQLYKDNTAPLWYNAYQYCTQVLPANDSFDISCTNLGNAIRDGLTWRPSAVWAKDLNLNTDNLTLVANNYQLQPAGVRRKYLGLSCNISYLMQSVYRERTDFHDHFVIAYINKYKDPLLQHNFTVGNWTDLGIAQFGGGYITQALANVRSTYMIVRNGMWRIGQDNYYLNFIEYSSWCVKQGYPQAWLYNLHDARTLLHSLARRDAAGVVLRRHIAYQGTTFFGDGVNFVRGVGALGDETFVREANLNHFNCTGEFAYTCSLLDIFYDSSATECALVEELYTDCEFAYEFQNNRWITRDQCAGFQTSVSSPALGIQCDSNTLYGNPHPYRKSVGNIVYEMLWALTVNLELKEGLWCSSFGTCRFMDGGMFATTTVRKLLFEGYTEPSVIKYLSLKHEAVNIGVECEVDPYDQCGKKQHKCTTPGVVLTLPNGNTKLLRYGNTSNEEYFAPYFIVTNDSDLLWPFAIDPGVVAQARSKMATLNYTKVFNPHFAVYPAWMATNDEPFQKHYQCQKRLMGGPPDQFNSCYDTLYTGRDRLNNTLNLKVIHGNDTIYPYNEGIAVNGSTVNNQYPPYLWPGFKAYAYDYLGLTAGLKYMTMTSPTMFNKLLSMSYTLYQKSLIFQFQRDFALEMPLKTALTNNFPVKVAYPVRRFVEDSDTWDPHRALGTSHDPYGMPFLTPKGMSSLERMSGFPIFAGTPHQYGNRKWGGIEYTMVTGTEYYPESQRTYQDYDPVTGRALRSALRQQINLRIQAGPMFPNVFSSQQRCVIPTKTFAGSSGYGCFAYVPLFWYEDAQTMDKQTFFRLYDHYYTRTERAALLTSAGMAFGIVFLMAGGCLFISEAYHRRKFKSRVYVD